MEVAQAAGAKLPYDPHGPRFRPRNIPLLVGSQFRKQLAKLCKFYKCRVRKKDSTGVQQEALIFFRVNRRGGQPPAVVVSGWGSYRPPPCPRSLPVIPNKWEVHELHFVRANLSSWPCATLSLPPAASSTLPVYHRVSQLKFNLTKFQY